MMNDMKFDLYAKTSTMKALILIMTWIMISKDVDISCLARRMASKRIIHPLFYQCLILMINDYVWLPCKMNGRQKTYKPSFVLQKFDIDG